MGPSAGKTSAIVMFLVAAAQVSAWLIAAANIPMTVSGLLEPLLDRPVLLMLVIMLLVFVVGTVLDFAPTILILIPVLMPTIRMAGIDPSFEHLISFTHLLESMLEHVRSETLPLDSPTVDLLVECGDYISELVDAIAARREQTDPDPVRGSRLEAAITRVLASGPATLRIASPRIVSAEMALQY